jgi:virginiamycin A acetyltransferase
MRNFASLFINYIFLLLQRVKNGNVVRSIGVSHRALRGKQIEISKLTTIDPSSSVGSYTYIGSNSNITKSSIGCYCSIANNVSIGQGEHKLNQVSTSSKFYNDPWKTLTEGDCVIESDVWIGVDAVVLRGVRIGLGAVVAANSVVTKDVPSFAIVAGSPARIIRYRLNEELISLIIQSEWWLMDFEKAKLTISAIQDK